LRQALSAKWTHLALYALMIGMPLLGWLTLSAEGKHVSLVGLQLPSLIGEDKSVADWAKEFHEAAGTIGYFLIGLHAVAALYHHYIVRDNTLRRMVPRGS
jgi:cytochrome b561